MLVLWSLVCRTHEVIFECAPNIFGSPYRIFEGVGGLISGGSQEVGFSEADGRCMMQILVVDVRATTKLHTGDVRFSHLELQVAFVLAEISKAPKP